ncbi:MAG: lysyl endopeptidase [Flavobacteriales bacterium]|jgi:lysyl endopeptidase
MKNTFTALSTLVLILSLINPAIGQVNQGGEPSTWGTELAAINFVRTAELDMPTIQAEDAENDQYKEFGYRFGFEQSISLNPESNGTWTTAGNSNIWQLGINCPNAKSISVRFNAFDLPKGAKVFIYDVEQTHYIGSFTSSNKQANGMLATSLVYSDNIIVQLELPAKYETGDINLNIDQIVHGYRGLDSKFEELKELQRGPFGNSGDCNININCPEGDDWQVEKKSVALIVSGGFAACTGALVNNTNNDGHPYFLTADHCLGGGVGNWVFYFNHETAGCNGNNGPTNQSVSGATTVASNGGSDFGLLEINNGNDIPASFNAEWAGWDNTDSQAAVTGATGIHHPSGDLKKICHETDAPYHADQGGAAVWYIDQWEEGVTEPGSSGSPLFNQDHRIIGQLYGGTAACNGSVNNGDPDWYGRFGVSWDGNSATSRLRDWLDPGNTGATTLDGFPTGAVVYSIDAQSAGISDLPEILCTPETVTPSFTLKNNGTTTLTSCTITYSYNGGADQTINWTGSLAQGATENIELQSFTAAMGTNTVDVEVSSPNGIADENNANNSTSSTFTLSVGEEVINLTIVTDDYGQETYWELKGPNNAVIASGGNTNIGPTGGGQGGANNGDPGAYDNGATITETIQLVGDGCYTFLIVDAYGDGMCCGYGDGSYTLTDANGVTVAEGAEYSDNEEKEFGMVAGLTVNDDFNLGQFNLFPNPSSGIIELTFTQEASENGMVSISDVSGRIVMMENVKQGTNHRMNLDSFESGVYLITLSSDKFSTSQRLILK